MGIEIERKFLVLIDKLPPLKGGERLIQGYLREESPQIRFRIIGDSVIITIKSPLGHGTRFEFEAEKGSVSVQEQASLKELALYPVIEKVRHRIPYAGLVWEVDVYQGANLGLMTVDVELPALDYPLVFPPWVDAQAEVTQDPRYFNTHLAQYPYSTWAEGPSSYGGFGNFPSECV
ncbi:MAG: adenylate cyclase [Desulfitobacteriaceae bacterium]|nr:adenylate cyclase [Desulfitobacteriaceae bacterium]MDI6877796.1 adenylate cyclase [Desulfitobacteriaceae bacterium]MDI6912865.1 adenylate cyclase [Desulfitobacteriaceae bacterium]